MSTLNVTTIQDSAAAFEHARLVQVVNTQTGAVATGTTVTVYDDTIPQNTEGDQYMTLAITPTNASNKLLIQALCMFEAGANQQFITALFQDSTAGALASSHHFVSNSESNAISLTHYMTAGTTSSTTFKIRAGGNNAATTTFNGVGTARKFGGATASSITISEIRV